MTRLAHTASAIAALLLTSAASAATITNRGDKEVKLSVVAGAERQEVALAPGKVVEGVCQKGCIIRLLDGVSDDYELDGSERVSIEEGFVYYDSLEAEVAPTSGSASGPKSNKPK